MGIMGCSQYSTGIVTGMFQYSTGIMGCSQYSTGIVTGMYRGAAGGLVWTAATGY